MKEIVETLANGKEVIVAITHNHFDHVGAIDVFKDKTILFPLKDKEKTKGFTYISDGYVIDLGDKKIKAIEVPGHTAGSMAFIEDELVITGDAIGSSYVWLFFMFVIIQMFTVSIVFLIQKQKLILLYP